jgi:tRNA (guanine37-N1)-methyltransferase
MSTWSPTLQELVERGSVDLEPYDLNLDYDYWTYRMLTIPHKRVL